ncbi:hypothetical protein ACH5RR_005025 [Cinchona calisaya]|uniref:Trichome birefringence-like N-terminal domain-containing protein n=1 Tax=Cinchona calisaya TaxID=153742 RepID=A0ABD3AZ92_9GENT
MAKKQEKVVDVPWSSSCNWWLVGSCSLQYVAIFFVSILFTIAFYTNANREAGILQTVSLLSFYSSSSGEKHHDLISNCDLFSGTWVYDNKSLPVYKDSSCTFMFGDLACEQYGRKDLDYQYWRWQPHNCDLPKFDAKAILNKLRDKRLVFVGDSLNRNQFVSFVCLIESSIPSSFKSMTTRKNLNSFYAKEYNATIGFYWAPFLVESNSDDPANHHENNRVVRVHSIEKHGKYWAAADILVFDSYLWWRAGDVKVIWESSLKNPNAVYEIMDSRKCFAIVLNTWTKWVLGNVDSSKTRLFWMSMSPTHSRASVWGRDDNPLQCYNETQLATKEQLRRRGPDPEMLRVTVSAIESLKKRGIKIDFLNITGLSEYRKDAHPSIYRKQWRPLTESQLADPVSYSDCTHWCLPGVPDVWNQLLYTYLLY